MKVTLIPPTIPEHEKNPLVLQLASFIEQQSNIIEQQAEQIQQLKDEIARLKDHPRKPDIKPSSLGKKKKSKSEKSKGQRPGSKKRKKTAELQIHETVPMPLENIPDRAEFKGYLCCQFNYVVRI